MFAITMSLGLRQLLDRKTAVITLSVLVILIAAVGLWGIIAGDIPVWWVVILGLAGGVILCTLFLPKSWHAAYAGGGILVMIALDIICLFGFIVPILR